MKRKLLEAAAIEVAMDLFGHEGHVEASIQSVARMALKISNTREAAGLSIFHGQDALEEIAQTLTLLTATRRQTGVLHTALDTENKNLGEPAKNLGDAGKPPMMRTAPKLVEAA